MATRSIQTSAGNEHDTNTIRTRYEQDTNRIRIGNEQARNSLGRRFAHASDRPERVTNTLATGEEPVKHRQARDANRVRTDRTGLRTGEAQGTWGEEQR